MSHEKSATHQIADNDVPVPSIRKRRSESDPNASDRSLLRLSP
jgi:hypothetical protein